MSPETGRRNSVGRAEHDFDPLAYEYETISIGFFVQQLYYTINQLYAGVALEPTYSIVKALQKYAPQHRFC